LLSLAIEQVETDSLVYSETTMTTRDYHPRLLKRQGILAMVSTSGGIVQAGTSHPD
jgi:hypothetical protein